MGRVQLEYHEKSPKQNLLLFYDQLPRFIDPRDDPGFVFIACYLIFVQIFNTDIRL